LSLVFLQNHQGELYVDRGEVYTHSLEQPLTKIHLPSNQKIRSLISCPGNTKLVTFLLSFQGEVYIYRNNRYIVNSEAELLQSTQNIHPILLPFSSQVPIRSLVKGLETVFFISESGQVYSCPHGPLEEAVPIPQLVQIPDNALIDSIITEQNSHFFISRAGKVYACGSNRYGQLGLGQHTRNEPLPKIIPFPQEVQICSVFADLNRTFFADSLGNIYGCGINYPNTILNIPSEIYNPTIQEGVHYVLTPQLTNFSFRRP
jgi:hypothetical protein